MVSDAIGGRRKEVSYLAFDVDASECGLSFVLEQLTSFAGKKS